MKTNEEKANEIARCDCQKHYKGFDLCNTYKFHEKKYCGRKAAALEAMEWKDEQIKAIAEIVADIFGSPFEYSPLDEDLLENEVCENCCNGSDCNDALCWMKYFEMKYKNKMTNNAK